MIKLILMVHHKAGMAGKELGKIIGERFPEIEREYCDNGEKFYKRMCQPIRCHEHEICVVLADTRERLEQLMGSEKLFERRRLLLILPENQKKVLSMGHRLMPRYVSCEMDSHEELLSVLEKVIDVLNSCDRKEPRHGSVPNN
jgi:hypothetical protein